MRSNLHIVKSPFIRNHPYSLTDVQLPPTTAPEMETMPFAQAPLLPLAAGSWPARFWSILAAELSDGDGPWHGLCAAAARAGEEERASSKLHGWVSCASSGSMGQAALVVGPLSGLLWTAGGAVGSFGRGVGQLALQTGCVCH